MRPRPPPRRKNQKEPKERRTLLPFTPNSSKCHVVLNQRWLSFPNCPSVSHSQLLAISPSHQSTMAVVPQLPICLSLPTPRNLTFSSINDGCRSPTAHLSLTPNSSQYHLLINQRWLSFPNCPSVSHSQLLAISPSHQSTMAVVPQLPICLSLPTPRNLTFSSINDGCRSPTAHLSLTPNSSQYHLLINQRWLSFPNCPSVSHSQLLAISPSHQSTMAVVHQLPICLSLPTPRNLTFSSINDGCRSPTAHLSLTPNSSQYHLLINQRWLSFPNCPSVSHSQLLAISPSHQSTMAVVPQLPICLSLPTPRNITFSSINDGCRSPTAHLSLTPNSSQYHLLINQRWLSFPNCPSVSLPTPRNITFSSINDGCRSPTAHLSLTPNSSQYHLLINQRWLSFPNCPSVSHSQLLAISPSHQSTMAVVPQLPICLSLPTPRNLTFSSINDGCRSPTAHLSLTPNSSQSHLLINQRWLSFPNCPSVSHSQLLAISPSHQSTMAVVPQLPICLSLPTPRNLTFSSINDGCRSPTAHLSLTPNSSQSHLLINQQWLSFPKCPSVSHSQLLAISPSHQSTMAVVPQLPICLSLPTPRNLTFSSINNGCRSPTAHLSLTPNSSQSHLLINQRWLSFPNCPSVSHSQLLAISPSHQSTMAVVPQLPICLSLPTPRNLTFSSINDGCRSPTAHLSLTPNSSQYHLLINQRWLSFPNCPSVSHSQLLAISPSHQSTMAVVPQLPICLSLPTPRNITFSSINDGCRSPTAHLSLTPSSSQYHLLINQRWLSFPNCPSVSHSQGQFHFFLFGQTVSFCLTTMFDAQQLTSKFRENYCGDARDVLTLSDWTASMTRSSNDVKTRNRNMGTVVVTARKD
ncbi:hypothetical protein BLNAU_4765 [Blattamonas nauphoetae]|uniref:Uncharacterized protein n=1 Tax=Blattamonas nauphoetae TaxID=2049346 RepID=A0ABQ9Y8X5_9EUKA|nr:hypothetical protein BLNAU_4765 [Blattamonas nauphoetae]